MTVRDIIINNNNSITINDNIVTNRRRVIETTFGRGADACTK